MLFGGDRMIRPLADVLRPQNINEVVGQKHIIGENKLMSNILKNKDIPNMIFYGPSGTGKTTVANICATVTDKKLYKLNATNASTKDIKDIASNLDSIECMNGVLLYLDEIQNFNKKQQQSLLEYIEDGRITLIASTTENPYFYVYNAILSRCTVVQFKPVDTEDIKPALYRAVEYLNKEYSPKVIRVDEDVITQLAFSAYGDVRKALTSLDICVKSQLCVGDDNITITNEIVTSATGNSAFASDKD
jgi:putative ATPase